MRGGVSLVHCHRNACHHNASPQCRARKESGYLNYAMSPDFLCPDFLSVRPNKCAMARKIGMSPDFFLDPPH